ncbi:hypothetical protein AB434_1532 [Heyndrickxia coagulans]|uniref:Uncharacterized protein n=1 Tax=Heyndrickxia coagulans TaxID=1398 RepID=A0AAN0T823_HEYCO|nr:hypothetical protein SB48_HM08orf06070 [Heyndrickxia coagulans]AKN53937.1 hypothetical protein AB434_1532 [Heyndrickxia coagulans]KYC66325.1 hypothetical protein B4100_1051 [Heyndrickxia coagulans]KYC86060.1 hypothetical protein B4096_1036 [Heyndrickxia coagulans]
MPSAAAEIVYGDSSNAPRLIAEARGMDVKCFPLFYAEM